MDREMPYAEYIKRMEAEGQHGNAVTAVWNDLADHLLFSGTAPRRLGKLVAPTLPVGRILGLLPGEFKRIPGMGPAKVTVYGAFYRSLRANPHPVGQQDPSRDLTLEGLQAYALSRYNKGLVTDAWNKLHRSEGISGPLTLAQLEAFCVKLRSKNPPADFKGGRGALLLGWYEHLKGA